MRLKREREREKVCMELCCLCGFVVCCLRVLVWCESLNVAFVFGLCFVLVVLLLLLLCVYVFVSVCVRVV